MPFYRPDPCCFESRPSRFRRRWTRGGAVRSALAGLLLLVCLPASFSLARAATLRVGPQYQLKLPSQAARVAKDGDVVEIEAGNYPRDAAVWRASRLTLRGVNGMAQLVSGGVTVEGKAIWVIKGNDTVVEDVGFFEARVPDQNGAGIRLEGANLTVRRCLFRDNENGILTGANAASEVLVENSEFDHNGFGDGYSHNLYIGAIGRFTLRDSISRQARAGHQVKSRAMINIITGNRLEDGPSGRSSYLIDLPSGGDVEITGNVLQQGPLAENFTMLAYGAENLPYAVNRLRITGNTFINDRQQGCRAIWVKPALETVEVSGNKFVGCPRIEGKVRESDNQVLPRQGYPGE